MDVSAFKVYIQATEVMLLLGCQQNQAYKIIRNLNEKAEKEGMMKFPAGKVNKHYFAKNFNIPEEDIEKAISICL